MNIERRAEIPMAFRLKHFEIYLFFGLYLLFSDA